MAIQVEGTLGKIKEVITKFTLYISSYLFRLKQRHPSAPHLHTPLPASGQSTNLSTRVAALGQNNVS
jgi:hypothetical protein